MSPVVDLREHNRCVGPRGAGQLLGNMDAAALQDVKDVSETVVDPIAVHAARRVFSVSVAVRPVAVRYSDLPDVATVDAVDRDSIPVVPSNSAPTHVAGVVLMDAVEINAVLAITHADLPTDVATLEASLDFQTPSIAVRTWVPACPDDHGYTLMDL